MSFLKRLQNQDKLMPKQSNKTKLYNEEIFSKTSSDEMQKLDKMAEKSIKELQAAAYEVILNFNTSKDLAYKQAAFNTLMAQLNGLVDKANNFSVPDGMILLDFNKTKNDTLDPTFKVNFLLDGKESLKAALDIGAKDIYKDLYENSIDDIKTSLDILKETNIISQIPEDLGSIKNLIEKIDFKSDNAAELIFNAISDKIQIEQLAEKELQKIVNKFEANIQQCNNDVDKEKADCMLKHLVVLNSEDHKSFGYVFNEIFQLLDKKEFTVAEYYGATIESSMEKYLVAYISKCTGTKDINDFFTENYIQNEWSNEYSIIYGEIECSHDNEIAISLHNEL